MRFKTKSLNFHFLSFFNIRSGDLQRIDVKKEIWGELIVNLKTSKFFISILKSRLYVTLRYLVVGKVLDSRYWYNNDMI